MVDSPIHLAPSTRPRAAYAWLWLMLILCALPINPALAVQIEVSLDRNPVPLDQSFTLTFSATEAPDSDPDFGPLEQDFDVLSQSQSNRLMVNNGRPSRSIEWHLTLMAKQAGTLPIPAIAFGSDRSEPFSVTVVDNPATRRNADQNRGVFIEVEVEPKNPYVQAQALYTVRILNRVALGEARLSTPEAGDALIQKLGDNQNLSSFVVRDGVQYKMTELRYVLFPQKSGPLRIEPMRLEVQTGNGRSLFSPFFGNGGRTQRISSDPVTLEVRPIPASFKGQHWLPAEQFELEDSWAKNLPKVAAGEPATRTLTAHARGATVGLLPELGAAAAPTSGDLKQYPDQPKLAEDKPLSGLSSLRQEKTALIAAKPGTYRLPAVEIPWWNTRADKLEIARLPERVLNVQPAAGQAPTPQTPPEPAPATIAPETPPQPAPSATTPAPAEAGPWLWIALFAGLGWFVTGLAWWISRRRAAPTATQDQPDAAASLREQAKALERACRANDPAAARLALVEWAGLRWPGCLSPAEELARRGSAELSREISLLDRSLYGRGTGQWQGAGLWQSFKAYTGQRETAGAAGEAVLAPLHRL
jgi:hypothetical protein